MRYLLAPVTVLLTLIIVSCASLTREDANRWLNSKDGEPGLDMTGKWDSGGIATGGWGEGNFIQDGKNFSGTLGLYYVDGVVTGESVYMAISSANKVYYTARLKKMPNGSVTGKAAESVIIDNPESKTAMSYLITLKKVKNDN